MKVYHQTGFRYNWNIDSFKQGVGDGLIYSPVNIDSDKLLQLSSELKDTGFIDPQLYLFNIAKGTLDTYPFFPGNLTPNFDTRDLDISHLQLAESCVEYQLKNNFNYIIIPTRYYADNPTHFLLHSTEHFVSPFCNYITEKKVQRKVLLSVIVKSIMLTDVVKRNEILNWITRHPNIDGAYLIFENSFASKQIKDFDFLLNALKFISILKQNEMEVHIGYSNTEAILYSIAMPDSISIGSYENLRSFEIRRFHDMEKSTIRSPNARLYSGKLFQWVDYEYIQAMRSLIVGYDSFFEDSEYKPLMLKREFNWHFSKPEPYKHYFYVFDKQIKELPDNQLQRANILKEQIKKAIQLFKQIEERVLLDDDSDGSHLATWHNVISAFQKESIKE